MSDPLPPLRVALGSAVQRLRHRAGFSQDAFAAHAGVHRTYVGSVERGEVNVSLDNIARLARGLGLPISALFLEAESQPPPASSAPRGRRKTVRPAGADPTV